MSPNQAAARPHWSTLPAFNPANLRRPGLTNPRPWQPLSDEELRALWPYFVHKGSGRPIFDIRARLDAIFWVACHDGPWKNLPPEMGPWDTAHRQFRRWVHKGTWAELLKAVALKTCPPVLRRLTHWLCRAWRRATRIVGTYAIRLARRLGLLSALKGPHWMLPDPDLSDTLLPIVQQRVMEWLAARKFHDTSVLKAARSFHFLVGGRRYVPACLAPP